VALDVMTTVQRLKSEGISVLLVEHNALSALAVSDRVYIMDLGKIIYEGSARALLEDEGLRLKLLGA
jgi:branched-chain amino acid transport system ATP-binding protein